MSRRRVLHVPVPAATISIGRSNSAAVSGVGSSFTIGWTSGGAAASGTWLVAVIHSNNGVGSISGGTAWTQIGTSKVFYKQCGGSEPTSYTVSYSGATKSDGNVVTICEVIGASAVDGTPASSSNTSTSPSVLSNFSSDCVVLAMGHDSAASTITPPSGWTKQSSISDATTFQASAIATKLNAGSGTIAPGAWNQSFHVLATLAFKA